MSNNLGKMQSCHKLLEAILQEAYHMDVLFFHTDDIQVPSLDRGMRDMMWETYNRQDSYLNALTQSREFHFLSVRSNLGFYNLIIVFPYSDSDKIALLSVGPFRDVEISPSYFNQIVRDTNLPSATVLNMKYHYEGLPQAPVAPVANITKQIITHFFPEFVNVSLEAIQYSNNDNTISVNNEFLNMYNIDFAEKSLAKMHPRFPVPSARIPEPALPALSMKQGLRKPSVYSIPRSCLFPMLLLASVIRIFPIFPRYL